MFEPIIIITSLMFLTAASISDLKTREVPDYISYSFIVAALLLRVIGLFLKEISQ